MRTDATGMTDVKVRSVHGARLAIGLVVALVLAVLAPVLLVNGASGLLVAGSVVLALAAGLEVTRTADAMLRPAVVSATPAEHTLAA